MKPSREEIEQEVLLKNWLDGLEPLERVKIQDSLKTPGAFATVEDEVLQAIPQDDAFDVDREEWKLAEELCLSLEQAERVLAWHKRTLEREIVWAKAEQLNLIVGFLCKPSKNLKALVRALALATGLAELNGTHSQAEVARELKVTRSLISYYVTSWADLLKIGVFKFRKTQRSRAVFSKAQKESWSKRKEK